MIRVLGTPAAPVPRLLRELGARGFEIDDAPARSLERLSPGEVMVIGPGVDPEWIRPRLEPQGAEEQRRRVLVLSGVGTHPDARTEWLQRLWTLEETARGAGHDVLTLRLAPLIGPRSPLWLRLRRPGRLPHGGRMMLNPVLERDAIETLARAVMGRAAWEGWYDVAGREVVTLAELAARARAEAGADDREPGEWEPPLATLAAQRPCDPEPWIRHFGLEPGSITTAERAA